MRDRDVNQSALARTVGIDRSTISQLLAKKSARLPNAQVVAECAAALGVSADWLLGLSDKPEPAADLLAEAMQVADAPRAMVDEQIFAWHQEAAGYKIRHVPATLPDMLKTPDMLRWEFEPHLGRTTEQAIGASQDRLNWMRDAMSDYEIAMPLYEVESLASSTGYYKGLPRHVRSAQIEHLQSLHDQLYPSLRVFLYDARRLWSVPVTIFGPLVATLYIGQHYMAFRDRERVQVLTRQFDWLVREADVSARGWPDHLQAISASGG
ncbi:MAG: helix-turn-helix domain-containing protein [Boseongicola sp.]|nr:MAG: helix-turn-helix domain-containing protein [Boseongicola sp.]